MRSTPLIRLAAVAALSIATAGCASHRAHPAGDSTAGTGQVAHRQFSEPPAAPARTGEHFLSLSMARPYTPKPPNGGTDDYRCFLIDPHLTQRTFITGSQFLPQNADVVHHAIFFRVDPGDVAQARALDAASPGDGWTCFGGTGIGTGSAAARQLSSGPGWIAAWAPGANETLLSANTGYEMQPGSQVVMQIHYNLLATGGRATESDKSGIRLRLVDAATRELRPLRTTLLPAPVELPCAPGESGRLCNRDASVLDEMKRYGDQEGETIAGLSLICDDGKPPVPGPTQHCDRKVHTAGTVYAVAGHMHLLGRSIKVELDPGTPRAKVLLNVPTYNFDDQGARPLSTPVSIRPGDTLRVTCTHDAGLRRLLPELRPLPPRYVVWGEGTSDEMCLGVVIWTQPS